MVVIPKWDRGIVKLVARSPESLVEFMTGMFILRFTDRRCCSCWEFDDDDDVDDGNAAGWWCWW